MFTEEQHEASKAKQPEKLQTQLMKPIVLNFNDPIETLSASQDLFFFLTSRYQLNKKEKITNHQKV